MDSDLAVMELLDQAAVSYGLVLTKIDEEEPAELEAIAGRRAATRRASTPPRWPRWLATSALRAGIAELQGQLGGSLSALAYKAAGRCLWGPCAMAGSRRVPMQDRNLRIMARWRQTGRVLVEALPYILQIRPEDHRGEIWRQRHDRQRHRRFLPRTSC